MTAPFQVNSIEVHAEICGTPCHVSIVGDQISIAPTSPMTGPAKTALLLAIVRATAGASLVEMGSIASVVIGGGVPARDRPVSLPSHPVFVHAPAPEAAPVAAPQTAQETTAPLTAAVAPPEEKKPRGRPRKAAEVAPAPEATSPDDEEEGSLAVGNDPGGIAGAPKASAPKPAAKASKPGSAAAPRPAPAPEPDEDLGTDAEVDTDIDPDLATPATPGFVQVFKNKNASIDRLKEHARFFDAVQYLLNLGGGPEKVTLPALVEACTLAREHSPVLSQVADYADRLPRVFESRGIVLAAG